MKELISKLKSRKFLACVAGIVTGVCLAFGADADTIKTVSGAATTIASILGYIAVEGAVDKRNSEYFLEAPIDDKEDE